MAIMSQLVKIAGWSSLPTANVIFVHGLMGHVYDTWRSNSGDPTSDPTFWPIWLAEEIPGLAIYSLSYDASASGWLMPDMSLQDRATKRKIQLRNKYFLIKFEQQFGKYIYYNY